MTRAEFENKNLQELIEQLIEEDAPITSQEDLKQFAIAKIKDDNIFLAVHILEAIHEDEADFYEYDYNMGTMEIPSGITEKAHIEHLAEE